MHEHREVRQNHDILLNYFLKVKNKKFYLTAAQSPNDSAVLIKQT